MNRTTSFRANRVVLTLLMFILCNAWAVHDVFGQRGSGLPGRGAGTIGGGGNVLYGDLKITGAGAEGSYSVTLYAGLNEIGKQTVGNGGRFRFNNVANGEYDLVVEFENQIIYRNRFRLTEQQPTDVRSDVTLEARVTTPEKPAVVSAAYTRSAENQTLYDRALTASRNNDLAGAINLLGMVVRTDPKDFVAWVELGTVYFKQDKFAESEDAYLRALQAKPDFFLALLNLGKLQLAQKKYEVAVDVLTKAIGVDPKSADAQQYLGEAYLGLKKGSKAIGPLNEAIRLDPKGKAEIHLRLAALYNGAGMKDKAAAEYEQFLVQRPDYAEKEKLQQYIRENKKP
jgi:tetratricopeptide (TPR) repeat protein